MDAAEPPRIVFESPAKCADGGRAEDLLRQLLARARTPGHAWVVTMRVGATSPAELRAEGEIVDDDGLAVGHRTFTGRSTDCSGLAQAIGVWASLVLDRENHRPRLAKEEQSPPLPERSAKPAPAAGPSSGAKPPSTALASIDPPRAEPWPPAPESDEKSPRREERTLELGVGAFLMTGTGGLLVGATPFFVIEIEKGFFLRPAIIVGRPAPSVQPDMTLAAGRLDGCLRVTGVYTRFHGIQLDLCGGGDVGVLETTGLPLQPYVALGPSMDLQGELGGVLSAIIRGMVGVNAAQAAPLDFFAARGELAISWRLQ